MKQIFEWLCGAILDKAFKIYDGTIAVDIHDVGDLINEAEAKWEADCCEWKFKRSDYLWESSCERFYHYEGHDLEERGYTFCPHCGKPIKISEVE